MPCMNSAQMNWNEFSLTQTKCDKNWNDIDWYDTNLINQIIQNWKSKHKSRQALLKCIVNIWRTWLRYAYAWQQLISSWTWRVHIKRSRCQSLNQGTWVDHVRAPQSFWIHRKRAPISLYPSQQAWSGRSGLSDTLLPDMSVTSQDEYIIIVAHYTYRYQITNAYNTRRCLILIMLIISMSKRLACV